MIRTTTRLAATLAAASLLAGCNAKDPAATTPSAKAAPASTPEAPASSAPSTEKAPEAPSATPGPTLPAKTFDCGAKGQKLCPMQAWMKSTMASASSSGDGDRLAKALTYSATRAPPGYDAWTAIARAGATKARSGDIDGAKESCKQCHDKYKDDYKATMRDRAY